MSSPPDRNEIMHRSYASESPFLLSASTESEGGGFTGELGMQAEVSPEGPYELDPYADLRPALRPEHATLAPAEIILTLGRQPAVLALHRMLAAPESQQAVLAVMLGHAGRRSIRVSGSTVPIPVYLRVLSRLCHEVAEQLGTEPAGRERFSEENADRVPLAGETIFTEPEQEMPVSYRALDSTTGLGVPLPVAGEAPQCVNSKHIISGFPEYGVTIDQLGTEQRTILGRIAAEIASGTGADNPIVAVLVVGHTDTALRKPLAERAAFEQSISVQRAANALNLIMREARQLAGSAAHLSLVDCKRDP